MWAGRLSVPTVGPRERERPSDVKTSHVRPEGVCGPVFQKAEAAVLFLMRCERSGKYSVA